MTTTSIDAGLLLRRLVQTAVFGMAVLFVAFLILFNFTDFF
ncbi:hypothetical protein [Rhodoplanes sp.]|nr:hypothetical protein [Rhodoplanes sp.]